METDIQSKLSEASQSDERIVPKEGQRILWENLVGDKFWGTVIEMDSNVAIVIGDDGKKHTIEC